MRTGKNGKKLVMITDNVMKGEREIACPFELKMGGDIYRKSC